MTILGPLPVNQSAGETVNTLFLHPRILDYSWDKKGAYEPTVNMAFTSLCKAKFRTIDAHYDISVTPALMAQLWITDAFLNENDVRTNDYGSKRLGEAPRLRQNEVEADEIFPFLAILFYMEVARLPEKDDYWSTSHPAVQLYCKRYALEALQLHLVQLALFQWQRCRGAGWQQKWSWMHGFGRLVRHHSEHWCGSRCSSRSQWCPSRRGNINRTCSRHFNRRWKWWRIRRLWCGCCFEVVRQGKANCQSRPASITAAFRSAWHECCHRIDQDSIYGANRRDTSHEKQSHHVGIQVVFSSGLKQATCANLRLTGASVQDAVWKHFKGRIKLKERRTTWWCYSSTR